MNNDPTKETRAEKRIRARETRKAIQREATRAAAASRDQAAVQNFQFRTSDALTVVSLPLGYAAMLLDNNYFVGACFFLCWLITCAPVTWHHELKFSLRAAWCAVGAVIWLALFWPICTENLRKELLLREGTLEVGNAPAADSGGCPTNPNGITINAGTARLLITEFPYALLTLDGKQNIILDRDKDGNLKLKKLIIFDDRHDKIVKIDDGKYWVHPNAQWQHPRRSKISVTDHADREVLSLDLQNRNSLVFRGQIFSEDGTSFSVTDNSIAFRRLNEGPATIIGLCLENVGFFVDKKGQGFAPGWLGHGSRS